MRTYEVPFVLLPNVADDDVDKMIGQFEQVVAEKGGKVVKVDRMGRRRLAYPIRKVREGNYVLLTIEGSGKEIAELERRLRVSSDVVLRYITIRIDEDLKRAEKVRSRRQARSLKRPRKAEGEGGRDDRGDRGGRHRGDRGPRRDDRDRGEREDRSERASAPAPEAEAE